MQLIFKTIGQNVQSHFKKGLRNKIRHVHLLISQWLLKSSDSLLVMFSKLTAIYTINSRHGETILSSYSNFKNAANMHLLNMK